MKRCFKVQYLLMKDFLSSPYPVQVCLWASALFWVSVPVLSFLHSDKKSAGKEDITFGQKKKDIFGKKKVREAAQALPRRWWQLGDIVARCHF